MLQRLRLVSIALLVCLVAYITFGQHHWQLQVLFCGVFGALSAYVCSALHERTTLEKLCTELKKIV